MKLEIEIEIRLEFNQSEERNIKIIYIGRYLQSSLIFKIVLSKLIRFSYWLKWNLKMILNIKAIAHKMT